MASRRDQRTIDSGMVFVVVDGPLGHEPGIVQLFGKSDGHDKPLWGLSTALTMGRATALCDGDGGFRDGYRIVGVMTPTAERRKGQQVLLEMMVEDDVISTHSLAEAAANCRE